MNPTLIIGAGLIGASIGQRLTERGVEVFLDDTERAHAVVAASRGAGLVAKPRPEYVALVVVATPPSSTAATIVRALETYPNAAVTDVASVKASIEQAVLRATGADIAARYIGSHPMAGSQHTGPLTAAADIFTDRTWVLVQRPGQSEDAITAVQALIEICGSRLVTMDAAQHDRVVAMVSHLPQLMSSLTAARLQGAAEPDLALAGQGLRDVTRVAGSDVGMWCQIVAANTAAVKAQLEAVRDDLDGLIDGLGDAATVAEMLQRGRDGAAALPGKHGRAASELISVVVRIPDTPGALARLFTDIEREGVNVEDLSIEHDPVSEVGYLAVQVTPERAESLADALRLADWLVR